MRPTADELLIGMRHVLEDVILPELESPWAVGMGTQMLLMLHHLTGRFDYEPRLLAEENRELSRALHDARAWLSGGAPSDDGSADGGADSDLEALRERNAQLRAAISSTIEQAYARADWDPDVLPTDRMDISNRLMDVLAAELDFWRPISHAMRPPVSIEPRQREAGRSL